MESEQNRSTFVIFERKTYATKESVLKELNLKPRQYVDDCEIIRKIMILNMEVIQDSIILSKEIILD